MKIEKTTVKDTEWDQINNEFEMPKDIYNPAGFEEIGEVIVGTMKYNNTIM